MELAAFEEGSGNEEGGRKSMTREILFRGYCSDYKRWVYGYYLKHEGCPEEGIEGCDAIGEPQKDLWLDWKEIDPLTLGQYSGFKDRYGSPLYGLSKGEWSWK